jgi:hypothetical protein
MEENRFSQDLSMATVRKYEKRGFDNFWKNFCLDIPGKRERRQGQVRTLLGKFLINSTTFARLPNASKQSQSNRK